jgi:hypothetical protein
MSNEQEWKWFSGSNEEEFSDGPFDTREQAIAALDGYAGFVMLARKVPLRLSGYFDADRFLEGAEDSAYDMANSAYDMANEDGDPVFDISSDQQADLEARVRAAIEAWQYAHNLTFMPWAFNGTKNLERIEGDPL